MGNCISRIKKKQTGDSAPAGTSNDKPKEDVTYASINHSNAKGTRATPNTDDDCDYAIVNIPAEVPPDAESEGSSKEECADDYVLMG